eukprot:TRINITY_DN10916_c0_g1_i2.p1 TRINITY_DN10916_c0_g1~~TRINITY_DN10916_c0_g1_i2.p1  ORF type:complete len:183 (+),score=35.34 TRINITY_DN10916_c0_g1_i2:69-617(+)
MPLFQKFGKENVTSASQTKSSEQRKVRQKILEQYPMLEDHIDDFMPPKATITAVKCQNHIQLITVKNEIFFFREREGPYFPTLKLLHMYPDLLPVMQVDIGGCKFVLGGANVMCPGLTSPGGKMDDLPERAPCQIRIEGKQHAVAVGLTTMSTEQIREVNKGTCITNLHYLGDGLWHMPTLE